MALDAILHVLQHADEVSSRSKAELAYCFCSRSSVRINGDCSQISDQVCYTGAGNSWIKIAVSHITTYLKMCYNIVKWLSFSVGKCRANLP